MVTAVAVTVNELTSTQSSYYHVGRQCLKATRLWFAGEGAVQGPFFEHLKEQTRIYISVLPTQQT